jgi:hypothetical protein
MGLGLRAGDRGQASSPLAAIRARGLLQERFRLGFSYQTIMRELHSHNFPAVEVFAMISPRPFAGAKLVEAASILVKDGAWRSIRAFVANIREAASVTIELILARYFIRRQDGSFVVAEVASTYHWPASNSPIASLLRRNRKR